MREFTFTVCTYNTAGQLASVTYDATGSSPTTEQFEYDLNGHRYEVYGGSAPDVDEQDRLRTWNGLDFTYTDHGHLETRFDGTDTTVCTYDALSQLRAVDLPGTATDVTYGIDAAGRRVSRSVDGVVTHRYLYSGDRLVAEVDAVGAVLRRYVYGAKPHVPDVMLDSSGGVYRLVTDHLGSVRLVVDASTGAIDQHMDYDVWGNVAVESLSSGFERVPFGFAGGLYDPLTGLVRFGGAMQSHGIMIPK